MSTQAKDRKKRSGGMGVRSLLVIGALLLTGLLLVVSTFGGRFGLSHQLTLELLGPLQSVSAKAVAAARTFWADYIDLLGVREENQRLKSVLESYEQDLATYREAYATYLRLQQELDFRKGTDFPPLTARVIGKDPSFWFHTIVVDRGENDGVVEGMTALNSKGVVGQVIHVSNNYSKVLLAIAPSSAIDVFVQKNRVRGILKGAGENGYKLHYVLKSADVARGDQIVTAGIGGVFASGIPVGTVTEVHRKQRGMFLDIDVEPSVDFQRLEFVQLNLSLQQSLIQGKIE
ncbi:MAG: rod shape-determining protein MreC [Desulfofustis sp.]|nr:rod shape-determining protein MreC [Desulfofustis sp.]